MANDMVAKRCEQCGKRIIGYNENHTNALLMQHKLVHYKNIQEFIKAQDKEKEAKEAKS